MLFEVKDVDRKVYSEHLADYLPPRMVDVHTHLWLRAFVQDACVASRSASWPSFRRRIRNDRFHAYVCYTLWV